MSAHLNSAVIDTPLIKIEVGITTDSGEHIDETVRLSLEDFAAAMDDLRALGFWEEVDPETASAAMTGDITVADFGASALKLRGFLYALTRAKVADSRIRASMSLSDFTMRVSDLQMLAQALEDAPADTLN